MKGHHLILYIIIIPNICFTLTVKRDINDVKYNPIACMDSRSSGSYFECTCFPNYNTVMSKNDESYLCRAPSEVQCHYSLVEQQHTYLVTEDYVTKRIFPELSKNEHSIHQVFIWNLHRSNSGRWLDVTKEALTYFELKKGMAHQDYHLLVINLHMDLWGGHVIKITFGAQLKAPCLTIKFKGKINYPFNIDKFKNVLHVSKTTTRTVTMTTNTLPPTTRTRLTRSHISETTGHISETTGHISETTGHISETKSHYIRDYRSYIRD